MTRGVSDRRPRAIDRVQRPFRPAAPIRCGRRTASSAIAAYIDEYDNPVRRHSTLAYQSPMAFEATTVRR